MSIIDEALFYASLGWRVVPIIPGQKRPAVDKWVERATVDPDLIRDWWTAHPDHGIGIVTGEQSGIWVLDVDTDKGGDDSLADLESEHGPLPDTVETITGSGGRHIFFKWPGWNPGTNAGILGPGLDIRAEGGQIVAPPTIHPNGRPYCFDLEHDPHDGQAVVHAPDWLHKLCTNTETLTPRREVAPYDGDPRPGDRFATTVTWPDLLEADGAKLLGVRKDRKTGLPYELWMRPGKTADEGGASASLYYQGSDVLKVFTTNWPGLTAGETYTRFGYLTATKYGGNFENATRALGRIQEDEDITRWLKTIRPHVAASSEDVIDKDDEDDGLPRPVDLSPTGPFWNRDSIRHQWICEPFLPTGRQIAFYAPAKLGKSLLAFEVAVALAAGKACLAQPAGPPIHVMYIDLEMTLDDLEERLVSLGYGPDNSPWEHLHFYNLPFFGPMDTAEGGKNVLIRAQQHDAKLVIVDTMARAVAGEENSADTYRNFYRCIGQPLKAAGISLVRIDHAGKDLSKGQRGSSEKNGDVDIVWKLTAINKKKGEFKLECTYQRTMLVPNEFEIRRHNEPNLWHEYTSEHQYEDGTALLAAELTDLGIPLDATQRDAATAYRKSGRKAGTARIRDALKWRNDPRKSSGAAIGADGESDVWAREADALAQKQTGRSDSEARTAARPGAQSCAELPDSARRMSGASSGAGQPSHKINKEDLI